MMGVQTAEARLFYDFCLCLDDHVPSDHLLRSIDRHLDLDGLRQTLKPFYSWTGRPSIDQELMIRMLIDLNEAARKRRKSASHEGGRVDARVNNRRSPRIATWAAQNRNIVSHLPPDRPPVDARQEEGCCLWRCVIRWTRCTRDSKAPIMRVAASWNMLLAT
jgi:hypothetical protein